MARTAAEYVRDLKAQRAVARQLAEALERHAEAEQVARLTGDEDKEKASHDAALWLMRAWRVETEAA